MSSIERIRKPIVLESTVYAVTATTGENTATNLLKKFANNTFTNSGTTFLRLPRPKFIGDYLKITTGAGSGTPSLKCELATSTSSNLTINGEVVQDTNGTVHLTVDLPLAHSTEYIAYATSLTNWNVYKRDVVPS